MTPPRQPPKGRKPQGSRPRPSPKPLRPLKPLKPRKPARARAEVYIDPAAPALQSRVEQLFRRLGCTRSYVLVDVTSNGKILAGAQGVKPLGVPIGRIIVDHQLLSLLPDNEVQFVLAHEAAHIYREHLVATVAMTLTRSVLNEVAREEKWLGVALRGWDVWKLYQWSRGALPPDADLIRSNELEADAYAVLLTNDKAAARSSLLRLVGNDLDAPSHTWEAFDGVQRPALSMRERLAAIDALPWG